MYLWYIMITIYCVHVIFLYIICSYCIMSYCVLLLNLESSHIFDMLKCALVLSYLIIMFVFCVLRAGVLVFYIKIQPSSDCLVYSVHVCYYLCLYTHLCVCTWNCGKIVNLCMLLRREVCVISLCEDVQMVVNCRRCTMRGSSVRFMSDTCACVALVQGAIPRWLSCALAFV